MYVKYFDDGHQPQPHELAIRQCYRCKRIVYIQFPFNEKRKGLRDNESHTRENKKCMRGSEYRHHTRNYHYEYSTDRKHRYEHQMRLTWT